MKLLPLMTLSASFDVNQASDRMDWEFLDIGVEPRRLSKSSGKSWNSDIFFTAGQSFCIALTATDEHSTNFESFQIIDCCLISRPRILRCGRKELTLYAPPSPFVSVAGSPLGALYPILGSAFIPIMSTSSKDDGANWQTMLWDGSLKVGDINAHWELSLYVTVSIQRAWQDRPQLRVFYFDPESEVGNGTTPPDVTN